MKWTNKRLMAVVGGFALVEFLFVAFQAITLKPITHDVRLWGQLGRLLVEGHPPYAHVVDNKPPLLLYLYGVLAWIDMPWLGTAALGGIGFSMILAPVAQWTKDKAGYGAALVAIVLFPTLLWSPVFDGLMRPVRLFVTGLIVTGVYLHDQDNTFTGGLLLGVASVIWQFAGIGLLLLLFWHRKERQVLKRLLAGYVIVPTLSFLLLFAWSPTAFIEGIKWTFASLIQYLGIHIGLTVPPDQSTVPIGGPHGSFTLYPVKAGWHLLQLCFYTAFLWVPMLFTDERRTQLFTLAFGSSLLIRVFDQYAILAIVWTLPIAGQFWYGFMTAKAEKPMVFRPAFVSHLFFMTSIVASQLLLVGIVILVN